MERNKSFTFRVRKVKKTDEPILREMLYQALYVPPGEAPFPRSVIHKPEIKRYVEDWGRPDDHGVVAVHRGKSIGAAWMRLLVGQDRGFGYVDDFTPELSIAVLPAYRGKEAGTKLLGRLMDIAQSHFHSVCLSVAFNNPAFHLYQRFGFETVKSEGTSHIMVRRW